MSMFAARRLRPARLSHDPGARAAAPPLKRPLSRLGAATLTVAALGFAASTASANPPGVDCPPGQIAVNGTCIDAGDPPPQGPGVTIDLAQQTTDRAGTHVRGYSLATDTSQPMSVQFKIDGVVKSSGTASVSRADVGNHGFDLTVPSARDAGEVCVTATDPVNHGHTTICRGIDRIKQFDATSISYDTAHAVIEDGEPVELDTVTNSNATTVRQTTTVSGSERLTDSSSWSDTQNLVVVAGADVSIPVVGEFGVEVTDTSTFVQNGSTDETHKWSWEQEVVVPAESKVVATVTITRSTLTLPYTLIGSYEYYSGAKVKGTLGGGTYHGVNSHDLNVDLKQYDLDGNRAAHPAVQPKPLTLQRVN